VRLTETSIPNKWVCGFAIVTVNAMFTAGGVCAATISDRAKNNVGNKAAHTTRRLCMDVVHLLKSCNPVKGCL
jgi:hypothetical protein